MPITYVKLPGDRNAVPQDELTQEQLSVAYKNGAKLLCSCVSPDVLELKVKRSSRGRLYPAIMPNTGERHKYWCDNFKDYKASATYQTAVRPGLEGIEEVLVSINDLKTSDSYKEPVERLTQSKDGKHSVIIEGRATLLGLLRILWAEAGLNRYNGRAKKEGFVVHKLNELGGVMINGAKLAEICYLPTPTIELKEKIKSANAFRDFIQDSNLLKESGGRALIVSRIRSLKHDDASAGDFLLGINYMHACFAIKGDVLERLEVKYKKLDCEKRDINWAILLCSNNNGVITVQNGAWMKCSSSGIPYDSGFEKTVLEYLCAQGREFEKPVVYDTKYGTLFPDFVLTDTGDTVYPMEVWGRDEKPYVTRKNIKRDEYVEKYGALWDCWWEWDARPGLEKSPPPLDKIKRKIV